jgi:hypothetical protein
MSRQNLQLDVSLWFDVIAHRVGCLRKAALRVCVIGSVFMGVASAQTAVLSNGKATYVLPDVRFPGNICPASIPMFEFQNSQGNSHGVTLYDSDHALVSYFGESRIANVELSTRRTLNFIDTSSVGYSGRGTLAAAPGGAYALVVEDNKAFVIGAPFSSATVSAPIVLPGFVASAQTQAIVFDRGGRAYIQHSAGVSVLTAPYTGVTFTITRPPDINGFLVGNGIALSSDDQKLMVAYDDRTVRVYTAPFTADSSAEAISVLSASYDLAGIAVTPDNSRALVTRFRSVSPSLISIASPFVASSAIDDIRLPSVVNGALLRGFEDISVSADGEYALLTGQADDIEPIILLKAPFTRAGATVCPIAVPGGRGAGAVRFATPTLQPLIPNVAGAFAWPNTRLQTSESGTTADFFLQLQSAPTSHVTINVEGLNSNEGQLSRASVIFTSGNWNVAQRVTITGVNDNVRDGDADYQLAFRVESADAAYNGLVLPNVEVRNIDDDRPTVLIHSPNEFRTTETGGGPQFLVRLGGRPTATVGVRLSVSDASEAQVTSPLLTFTTANWNVDQIATVVGLPDGIADGDVRYEVRFSVASTDLGYSGLQVPPLNFVNADDGRVAGVNIAATEMLTTSESGATATFSVRLNSEPYRDVRIDIASSNTREGIVEPASITFHPRRFNPVTGVTTESNWNTPQVVTIRGVADTVFDGDQTYNIAFALVTDDPSYQNVSAQTLRAINRDVAVQAAQPTQVPIRGMGWLGLLVVLMGVRHYRSIKGQ